MPPFSNTSSVRAQTSSRSSRTDPRNSPHMASSTNSSGNTANSEYHESNATAVTSYSRVDVETDYHTFTYDLGVPGDQVSPASLHYYLGYSSEHHSSAEYSGTFKVEQADYGNIVHQPDTSYQYQQVQHESSSQPSLYQVHPLDTPYPNQWEYTIPADTTTDQSLDQIQPRPISPPSTPTKCETRTGQTPSIGLLPTPPQTPQPPTPPEPTYQIQSWLGNSSRDEQLRVGLSLSAKKKNGSRS